MVISYFPTAAKRSGETSADTVSSLEDTEVVHEIGNSTRRDPSTPLTTLGKLANTSLFQLLRIKAPALDPDLATANTRAIAGN